MIRDLEPAKDRVQVMTMVFHCMEHLLLHIYCLDMI